MLSRRNIALIFTLSFLIMGAVFVSATLPIGSSNAQFASASDVVQVPNYRTAGNSQTIIVQVEPSPTALSDAPTDEPAPTAIVVATLDPSDPATNPAAPGGILATVLGVVIGFLTGALVMFIGILSFIAKFKDDKITLTTIEKLVDGLANSFPAAAPLKPLINQTGKEMQEAGSVLDQITDGKPNI